ncbi:DEAD/DEAH box helicase family protein [Flavobacterium sp. LaA7.5]|nr:DEAD/DEAH box helicase family protein [Flavobacterium salilacus subsp. altitudinum]
MNLPNSYFEGFPIEFKEINPEDFPGFEIENDNKKVIIEPNDGGYISDAFQAEIDLRSKNTVVVNAAVGQGKSTAIVRTIGKYYHEHPDTLIIVATPFVSLVEQYCNDIHSEAEIPEEHIYNYGNLGRNDEIDYTSMRVQVLTVNTLLGNPGEDAFKNSDIKRRYLNTLISHCRINNLKTVFIYDEIHDAIQNFKQEFIFSLWKWREVILKNYILSATYNEASKVVIKYLAELTDKKIQIIETERTVNPEKQSKLYLHYSPAHQFKATTPEIVAVIKKLVRINKNIDILSYSKVLAKDIINDKQGIGKLLEDKFGEINDCTSELVANQRPENEAPKNRYDNTKCNIGTNFKTGISIKKRNHAYVIILPPRASRLWFRNRYGIFSGGINSIIQAIARQRTQGEIHIILPFCDAFNYSSLPHAGLTEEQIQAFQSYYNKVDYYNTEAGKEVHYFPLNIQDYLTTLFYKEQLHYNVHEEINYINSKEEEREGLPSLKYPEYETWKLNNGEDYIANNFKFFGEDIAAYVTYCAFTNQFVNCKLHEFNYKITIFFKEGEICEGLKYVFNKYFGDVYIDGHLSYLNFSKAYSSFRNELFSNYIIKFKKNGTNKWKNVLPYKNKNFEIQLLRFIAHKFYGLSYYRAQEFSEGYSDLPYSRSYYFLDSLSTRNSYNSNESDNTSEENRDILRLYEILNHFRNRVIQKIQHHESSQLSYGYLFRTMPRNFFDDSDIRLFNEFVSLLPTDPLLHNEVFQLKQRLNIKNFYKKLIEDFFISEESRLSVRNRPYIHIIREVIPLPESSNIVDLISEPTYHLPYTQDDIIEHFGSYENFAKEQEEINALLNNL